MEKILNFIDGSYQEPINKKYIENYNPSEGKVYSLIADSDKDDVDLAVKSAKKAFDAWSKTTTQERSNFLNKIADLLEEKLDLFAKAEAKDQGKPFNLAKSVDIPRAIHNFRFFADFILYHKEEATNLNNIALNYTTRKPLGIVGLISPWNLPLYLLTWKIAPALAMGNVVICKPSEFTSMTAFMLGEILNLAALPKGVCNIVMGTGKNVGKEMVLNKNIAGISFTGGTFTAKEIIRDSAETFKKLSLELGGKNPNIIYADANLEECITTTIRSSFSNQGEICLCGSRIYVQEEIYDIFVEKFVKEVEKLVIGDPFDEKTNIGALVSKQHFDKVMYYIDLAQKEGGKILTGGYKPELSDDLKDGYFIKPTIITNLDNSCRTIQEEIFGPVVTISKFKTQEEVINYANDTIYGLSTSIWTQDISKALQTAEKIEAGTIWINTWMLRDLRVPFGGMKASGIGREGGQYSMDFYTELKNVCIKYVN
ncbi:MAG: aldehyde dehydrogenase [Candidatus Sericytochromatia bacterium]